MLQMRLGASFGVVKDDGTFREEPVRGVGRRLRDVARATTPHARLDGTCMLDKESRGLQVESKVAIASAREAEQQSFLYLRGSTSEAVEVE